MMPFFKGRVSLSELRNSPEQQEKNLNVLESMGIKYVSTDEYYDNKDKYEMGIGFFSLKKSK